MKDGLNSLKISVPQPLIKTFNMTPPAARFISLDKIFKRGCGSVIDTGRYIGTQIKHFQKVNDLYLNSDPDVQNAT
jgi:hypothetical protein